VLLHTHLIQAWHALNLTRKTTAIVSTEEYFIAGFLHEIYAFLLLADVEEGWFLRSRGSFNFFPAEAALPSLFELLLLFTCPPNMVWIHLAVSTENALAFVASDPVLTHILSCLPKIYLLLLLLAC
jgi:hypothetical protein